ncbi:MAG: PHP domain-containing protein [Clostridiaceae bacterium]|nr:PHP domain-containing protein [Clostridiaceae bacterium]
MLKKGDFHMHTTASDGKLTPSELVKMASQENLDIIAITDHDTTKGLSEGIIAGQKYGVKVIPGIEFSTLHKEESIHILGYFRDDSYKSEKFQVFLNEMHDYRAWRGQRIVDNLKIYFDINIDGQQLIKDTKGVIARPHIAQAIINAGYDYSWEYLFNNIISKDSPAYVPNKSISITEGIKILKEVNALLILAHPTLIKKSTIEELIEFDFDGIEGIYPLNSKGDTEKYLSIAKEKNKIITAGSDYHGIGSQDTKHGILGSVNLTGENLKILLENLKGGVSK